MLETLRPLATALTTRSRWEVKHPAFSVMETREAALSPEPLALAALRSSETMAPALSFHDLLLAEAGFLDTNKTMDSIGRACE